MPSSPPPPRRKSCDPCIRTKRRCDQNSPCSRCLAKGFICTYKHVGPAGRSAPSSRRQPEGVQPSLGINASASQSDQDHGDLPFSSAGDDAAGASNTEWQPFLTPEIPNVLQPKPVPRFPDRLDYVTGLLRNLSRVFVDTGSLPFLQIKLYDGDYPSAIYAAFSACAAYQSRNEANKSLVLSTVSAKAQQIVDLCATEPWSMMEKLASVQALVVLQALRIFDGDIRQRTLADRDQIVLLQKARELYESLQCNLLSQAMSWKDWLLLESVRRTVIAAFLIDGTYSLEKLGHCVSAAFVKMQPFSVCSRMWYAKDSYEWDMARAFTPAPWQDVVSLNTIEKVLEGTEYRPELDTFAEMVFGVQFGEEGICRWRDGCNVLGPESSPAITIV